MRKVTLLLRTSGAAGGSDPGVGTRRFPGCLVRRSGMGLAPLRAHDRAGWPRACAPKRGRTRYISRMDLRADLDCYLG